MAWPLAGSRVAMPRTVQNQSARISNLFQLSILCQGERGEGILKITAKIPFVSTVVQSIRSSSTIKDIHLSPPLARVFF